MRNWINFLLFAFILTSQLESVENSIIPFIEKYEQYENLPIAKYSSSFRALIKKTLKQKDQRIRLVSYNMLFDLYDENLEEINRWPNRLPRLIELITEMNPDIIGIQELHHHQIVDLLSQIGSKYDFYSKPSQDGELNGIFYRKNRFEVLNSHVWYMTETSDTPSAETLTMVELKDEKTNQRFAVFNTHLSFSKIDKRDFQARFIAKKIREACKKIPVVLTGDFNTFPHRLDLEKLPFYDGDFVNYILTRGSLQNAKNCSLLGHLGPLSTFTNHFEDALPFKGTGTPGVFLDHIYVNRSIRVLIHAVQPSTVNGHFPSDHMPVMIDFIIPTRKTTKPKHKQDVKEQNTLENAQKEK